MRSEVRKRTVEVNGRNTSFSMESEFYVELRKIAYSRGLTIETLVGQVSHNCRQNNLSSELRLTVLRELQKSQK